ncbi:sensor histidine kinase [Janibacter anophelis]|uniref:sensor histidine kinase n=1 Tax=Janibacter anophelis TaxID=319054 RepID=UPI000DEF3EC2|nr:histidine kinase [Janibacter anophelis]
MTCAPGTAEEDRLPDPWARWGWLLAAIWLVFLGFPAASIVQDTGGEPVRRVLLLGLLVAFAATYVWGFIRGQGAIFHGWERLDHVIVLGCAATMVAIMLVLVWAIGPEALGTSPFIASMAAFSFPDRLAVPGVLGTVAASGLILWATGDFAEVWPFLFLPALLGAFGLLMRAMTRSDVRRETLQRSLAVSAERDRVARDVHDVLGHSLTVVSLKADLAERLVDRDPERAKAEIAAIQQLTRQSLAEIRATVAGLRVMRLADERDAAAEALRAAGIEARLPDDVDVVDPAHRITMAWALRETTTNVVRHSGASRVDVGWGPTWLEVCDDGRGLRGRREGTGLTGLRERVTRVGGHLDVGDGITGPTGPGTKVRVELP